jgi:hypothetical protein
VTRDDLIEAIRTQEAHLAALRRMLAEMDAQPSAPRYIDTGTAMKIAGRSSSWLYSAARRFGFGHKTASGSWQFDADALRAFRAGMTVASEDCEPAAKFATATDSTNRKAAA